MPSFSSAPVYDTSKWLEDFYMLLYRYTLSDYTHASLITKKTFTQLLQRQQICW